MSPIGKNSLVLMIILLIVGVAIGYPLGMYTTPSKEVKVPLLQGEILIGHVMSEMPEQRTVSTEIAEAEVNEYVQKLGLNVTFKVLQEWTEESAVKALEKVQSLAARGVKVITGLTWSSHITAVKDYCKTNKILVLSDGSSAPALAIADDWVFRLVCDDRVQGKAIARLLVDRGIKAIVVMQRADAWGDGLYGALDARYTELGGIIVEHIRYDPAKTEFSTELTMVNTKISEAIATYGEGKVALQVLGFSGDVVPIQVQAASYPLLMNVTWIGSDGHAMSTRLMEEAADLAAQTKHICTYMAPTESSKYTQFVEKYVDEMGMLPTIYNVLVYDCVWLLAKTILEAESYDAETIKNTLPEVASMNFGATGWTKLNDAGDRAASDYTIWAVLEKDGEPQWTKVGSYSGITDEVKWGAAV